MDENKNIVTEELQELDQKIQEDLKEVQEDDNALVKKFLEDPKTVTQGKEATTKLFEIFKNSTFDVDKVTKRTPWRSIQEAQSILQLLQLLGSVSGYFDTFSNKYKYKITQSEEDRKEIYELEIMALEKQREHIESRIIILKTKIFPTQ